MGFPHFEIFGDNGVLALKVYSIKKHTWVGVYEGKKNRGQGT